MQSIPELIGTAAQDIKNKIDDKWTIAAGYADEAFERALAYLTEITRLQFVPEEIPEITWDEITFDFIDTTITKPTLPVIEFREQGTKPVAGELKEFPNITFPTTLFNDLSYDILRQVIDKLATGGTGLSAEVEAAIWANARNKMSLANQEKYAEAEGYFEARGFDLPPGALSGRLLQIQTEIMRSEQVLANDIMVKSADLAADYTKFIEGLGLQVVTGYEQNVITRIASSNKNVIDVFLGQMEGYKTDVQAESMRIEALSKVTNALMDGYKADIQALIARIDAAVRVVEAKIKINIGKADITEKIAELKIKVAEFIYGLQVEAAKAGASVCAQLAASALASVNASISEGFSAGANEGANFSESKSYDMTKSTPIVEYIHNYSE